MSGPSDPLGVLAGLITLDFLGIVIGHPLDGPLYVVLL